MRHHIAALLCATIIAAPIVTDAAFTTPTAAPLPSAAASPDPATAYKPIPCDELVARANLANKPVTADALGDLLAAALKAHGYTKGSAISRDVIGKSIVDFAGCFGPAVPK